VEPDRLFQVEATNSTLGRPNENTASWHGTTFGLGWWDKGIRNTHWIRTEKILFFFVYTYSSLKEHQSESLVQWKIGCEMIFMSCSTETCFFNEYVLWFQKYEKLRKTWQLSCAMRSLKEHDFKAIQGQPSQPSIGTT